MEQIAARRGSELAQKILQATNESRKWGELLDSKDQNIVLKAMIYLSDRAYGKAPQAVIVEAPEGYRFGIGDDTTADNATEPIQ
jgi:hypothetical protein